MVGTLSTDDGRIGDQWKVNARIWDQIGLELSQVHVEGAVKAQRSGYGGDNLADEAVQVAVAGTLNVEVAAADVKDGLIVDHEGAVGVLQRVVRREDAVVRLDNGSGHLRRRVDGKLQLALLPVVHREALHEEAGEAAAGAAAEGVENEKALQAGALVGEAADAICKESDENGFEMRNTARF